MNRFAERLTPSRFSTVARASPDEIMTAAVYTEHGAASVVMIRVDFSRPLRAAGQTLVRVRAAAVNPVDYKMWWHCIPTIVFPTPKIPGTDFAGEVVSTESNSGFRVGKHVYGMMPLLGTPWGACAE